MNVLRNRWLKVTLVVGGALFLAFCSFWMGYVTGWTDHDAIDAPSGAVQTVSLLKSLREGKADTAIKLLEIQLDTYFVAQWSFDQRYHPWSGLFWSEETQRKLMRRAVSYRQVHPNPANPEEVSEVIADVVKRYGQGQ